MKPQHYYLSLINFIAFFMFFILYTRYATVDDFIFNNLIYPTIVERTGYIDLNTDPFPGFTIICVMYSKVLSMSYESVVALPYLEPAYITILILITQKLSNLKLDLFNLLILANWMFFYGLKPTLFCHTIGLVLFYILIYISFLRLESDRPKPLNMQLSLLLIILIEAINIISYKTIFITIIFFIVTQIIMSSGNIYYNKKISINNKSQFKKIVLIAGILTLTSNWVLYQAAVPTIRASSEHPFEGLNDLFSLLTSLFAPRAAPSIISYQFAGNTSNLPLALLWHLLVAASMITCFGIILVKFIKYEELSLSEACIESIIFTGIVIFFVYNPMGYNELSYMLTGGLLGYSILTSSRSALLRISSILGCLILLLLVIIMNLSAISGSSYGGQTDRYEFQYLNNPALWCNTHVNPGLHRIYSDQLTRGYFAKEAYSLGITCSYHAFPKDIVLSILEPEIYISDLTGSRNTEWYIFNYKLGSFAIEGWFRLKAWIDYKKIINNNIRLNIFYSSGNINICG